MARLGVLAWLVIGATHASAEPRVAIRATGACPSAAAIERALGGRVELAREGATELVVEEVEGGAIVRMTTATGPIDARLESHDCAVLASAVAAVADAWFVELPARSTAPPASEILSAPTDTIAERPDVAVARVSPRWNLALARALVLDPERATTAAATQIDVGWWTRWRDVRVSARFTWGGKAELVTGDAMTAADRQTWGLVLQLGRRSGRDRFWFEVGGGAGIVVGRVSGGTTQQMGEVVRLHAAVAGTLAVGVRLGAAASLRFDVNGLLYPLRDRYTIAPITVARSPLAEVAAGIGLEVAFGERIW
jgi:hypothetical protein